MSHSLLRRAGITLATAALAVTAVLSSAPTASAAPAGDAAGWLAGQLEGGPFPDGFGGTDFGLTIDAGTALLEINRAGGARQVRDRLEATSSDYYTGDRFDDVGSTYANALAKLTSFVQATGGDARAFDGNDLVQRLEGQVSERGATQGRIVDTSEFGDFANSLGQSFAVRALAGAGSPQAVPARSYLLLQQCREGYFRLNMGEAGARRQSCDAAGPRKSKADLDTTAINLINLQQLDRPGRQVNRAIRSGLAWVADQQRRDGSFGSSAPTTASNANSTGLAAWALGEGARCGPAAKAATWVRSLQLGNGAIAYDRPSYRAARGDGVTRQTRDQFRRATAQAAPGLEYLRVKACRA